MGEFNRKSFGDSRNSRGYRLAAMPGPLQRRLQQAMEHAEASQDSLAAAIGIKQPSVSAFLSRDAKAWRHTPAAARFLGVRLDWLANGSGPMSESERSIKPRRASASVTEGQPAFVPEIDLRAGAGGGGLGTALIESDGEGNISEEITKGQWLLPADYMRELSVSPRRAFFIEIKGDSMSPTLESGDRVMVDALDRMPSPPGVFVIWDGFGVVAKRLTPIRDETPRLKVASDNPKHDPYEVSMDEAHIIGRVVLRVQRM